MELHRGRRNGFANLNSIEGGKLYGQSFTDTPERHADHQQHRLLRQVRTSLTIAGSVNNSGCPLTRRKHADITGTLTNNGRS